MYCCSKQTKQPNATLNLPMNIQPLHNFFQTVFVSNYVEEHIYDNQNSTNFYPSISSNIVFPVLLLHYSDNLLTVTLAKLTPQTSLKYLIMSIHDILFFSHKRRVSYIIINVYLLMSTQNIKVLQLRK